LSFNQLEFNLQVLFVALIYVIYYTLLSYIVGLIVQKLKK